MSQGAYDSEVEATLNDPFSPQLVKLVANNPTSAAAGADLLLATLTLPVVQSGVTLITGEIIELISDADGVQNRRPKSAIGAGKARRGRAFG